MALRGQTNDGFLYLLPKIVGRITFLVPMMFLWKVVGSQTSEAGMTAAQLLTYTYISALLADLLSVETFASSWCYEGELQKLFTRPASVFGSIVAETSGGWVPMLACFSLPMLCVSPLFGVNPLPATVWFFPSLLLCVSLGFAVDMIFSCLAIMLRGMAWLSYVIRRAVASVLGAV
jgi:ABC-2 type transport system permease protein